MLKESPILEEDFIFLLHSKNESLKKLISKSADEENIAFQSVSTFTDLTNRQPAGKFVTFIIGSDIEDPVQSAQRFHTLEKDAKIILLTKSDESNDNLKEVIRFSPSIGTDVHCLNESDEQHLDKLNEVLQSSIQAEKYRSIIANSNSRISATFSSQKPAVNQEFVNKLMDIAPIGIVIVNRDGKILGWNKEATSIFNKNEAQVLGTPFDQLFGVPDGHELKGYLKQCFSNPGPSDSIQTLDLERELQGNDSQFLNLTAAHFTYHRLDEQLLVLAIKDITNRVLSARRLKELNRELEEQAKELAASNAELEQFAFVASHDLQEPLRMITSFLSQLEKKYNTVLDERGKKYIYFATDGAKRMRQVILDLLEFSRVGYVNQERNMVDMNQVLEEVLSIQKELIRERNAIIEYDQLPEIHAVKSLIRQLFQNLINNAIKYQENDNQPVVKISWSEDDDYWHFRVRDNGIGIEDTYSVKIFNIFQRLHGKDEYTGTGVGLAICKKIVQEHGGEIGVESQVGKGSTFYFTIAKTQIV
jgi:PAS domain S-box-containing protein